MNRTIFLAFLLISAIARGQSVSINLNISPPYTPYLADYLNRTHPLTLQLKNNTRETQSVKLLMSFSGDNGVSIRTKANYSPSRPIVLNPGEVKLLKSLEEFTYYFDEDNLEMEGITAENLRLGGLPESNYRFCLQAVEFSTGRVLSFGEPLGCSNLIPISYVEPPTLVFPGDNQVITGPRSQPVTFTWARPVGFPASAVYTFRLVELPDSPDVNANTFIDAVSLPTYELRNIRQTLLVYNASLPMLKPGKRYAIRITANDPQRKVAFLNNGHSVVTTFVYVPD